MFWMPDIAPDREPLKVLLKRGDFIDPARGGRVVPYKIYHPTDHGGQTFPIILWSHGFGGNRDGAAFLSRYLAAQGYVIVHMTHPGTDSSLWEGKPGHPWDILRETKIPREVTFERMHDVPFVLNQLQAWAEENPEIGPFMDFSKIGMSGHSFGSLSTQVAAGMNLPDRAGHLHNLRDERIKAGILYSPVPVNHMVDDHDDGDVAASLYGGIAIPLLHMTGTEDSSPIGGAPYTHRLVVFEKSTHPEKYLLVKQGGDHMVYNGTRGKLDKNDKRDLHETIIKIGSLAFWDAMLKDDKAAKDWLKGRGVQNWLGEAGEFTAKS
jgi:dienelactone hydrolase